MRRSGAVAAMLAALVVCQTTSAQPFPTGPTGTNPLVAAQREPFEAARAPADVNLPRPAPPIPPEARRAPGEFAPRRRRKPGEATFFLGRVRVEGNTVLEPKLIADAVAPFVERESSFTDLQEMIRAVRRLYRERGYVFAKVRIPPQNAGAGPLRMVVEEGRIGRVGVFGNRHHSDAFILRFFHEATDEEVVRSGPLIASLLRLDDFPGVRVHATLQPGQRPCTSDIRLDVTDDAPVHASLEYNDYGLRLLGRNHTIAGIDATGLIEGDELIVRASFPFPSSSDPFYQGSYAVPIGDDGVRLVLDGAHVQPRVGLELAALGIHGVEEIAGARVALPLERTVERTQDVSAGLTVKNVRTFTAGSTLAASDHLRIANLAYAATRTGDDSRDAVALSASHGLGVALDGSPDSNTLASRPGTGDTFSKLNGDAVHVEQLTSADALLLRGNFQLATRPLTVAELYPVGGPDSVRGFTPAEFLADDGWLATAELQHTLMGRTRLAAFVDQGYGELQHPLPGEVRERYMTSIGTGVRAAVGDHTTARVDLAYPVNHGRNADGETVMLYAQLQARY